MKIEADAKLVTVYVNSTDRHHGQALYAAIVQLCKDRAMAGATVTRCEEGFGASGRIHTTRLMELAENLPVRIEIVDIEERIAPFLAALEPMIGEGLVTVSDVRITRYLRDPKHPPG
ncbi:MAG: DUF190 domain-containing protein [Pirellulaceae bacterium]|nr:DUF190 domain-containing protein [Pirellulaceae bacterium]